MNISKILVCLIGLTISSLSTQAQSQKQEVDQITTTLNYYLEGGTNNDYATLAKAFHPEAMMQSVGGNGHQNVNVLASISATLLFRFLKLLTYLLFDSLN